MMLIQYRKLKYACNLENWILNYEVLLGNLFFSEYYYMFLAKTQLKKPPNTALELYNDNARRQAFDKDFLFHLQSFLFFHVLS